MLQAMVKRGRVLPLNVPKPMASPGAILIKVVNSCISAGTELPSVEGSGRSLIRRAIEQPENVKRVLSIARSEGISKAISKVRGNLKTTSPIGYSIAGVVLAVGKGVTDIRPGDYVAAAGSGLANHAEFVNVPRNLVMHIPEGVDFAEASSVALGGIALHGVRRANVQVGEYVVVFGAGIIGQLVIQLLNLAGARVIAFDLDESRLKLAEGLGAEAVALSSIGDPLEMVLHYTGGHGADAVLFCAATNAPEALSRAFAMTRRKGRLVMVGVYGSELKRSDIYLKELDFLISTSYGPGRYDEDYEERGVDYPYAYVRWTENRNMQEYLRLLATGRVRLGSLIQGVYPIDRVDEAFNALQSPNRQLMVLLEYGRELPDEFSNLLKSPGRIENAPICRKAHGNRIRVGLIGAGAFAVNTHLPNLRKLSDSFEIRAIASKTGHKAQAVAEEFGAVYSTTDYEEIVRDSDIDLVMVCTRHNLHGHMVLQSLLAGKHTFVEKPLCTTREDLDAIKDFFNTPGGGASAPLLMVGFNRRFSNHMRQIRKVVEKRIDPMFIHYRMNAGYVPPQHWSQTSEGGGRIIGEACHIIDLFSFLIDAQVRSVGSSGLFPKPDSRIIPSDNKSIVLEYEDGSLASLDYFAVGSNRLPKECLELHFDGKTIVVDDYKQIHSYGVDIPELKTALPEKGHMASLQSLAECLRNSENGWPIPLESILETTRLTLEISGE